MERALVNRVSSAVNQKRRLKLLLPFIETPEKRHEIIAQVEYDVEKTMHALYDFGTPVMQSVYEDVEVDADEVLNYKDGPDTLMMDYCGEVTQNLFLPT